MSITYDPMTGEPIETPDETTTETVTEAAKEATEEVTEATTEVAADAATDAAAEVASEVNEAAEEVTEIVTEAVPAPVRRFDPMTGEPIDYSKAIPDDPEPSDKSGFGAKAIVLGLLGVAIVAALIFVASQFLFSKRVRVERAIAKTMNVDSQLYKDARNLAGIIQGKSYSMTASFDGDDFGSLSGSVAIDGKDKQVGLEIDVDELPEFSLLAGIDSKSVKAEIPEFFDYLFVYNYTEDNDGYITEQMSDKDIEALNTSCKLLYEFSAGSDEYAAKVAKLTRTYEKKLKWKKTAAKSYKVNDKKVKCKGYTTTLEKDLVLDYWDDFTDIYLEEFGDLNESLQSIGGTDLKDSLKDVKDELKSMKDVDLTFYIYKGALAAIKIEAGKDGEAVIMFKGGDYRAQNILVEVDGDEVFELKGDKSKDKENYTISAGGKEIADLTYNTKKGTLAVEYEDYRDSYEYEFDIKSSGKNFTISADDIDIDGDELNFSIEVTDSGKIADYTNTDEFDIGNADEDDFKDLVESLDYDKIGSLSYYF